MSYRIRYNLPFVSVHIHHRQAVVEVPNVLLDTGSATTIFSADVLGSIGIAPSPDDRLRRVAGIGGTEIVYEKHLDLIRLGSYEIPDFVVQIGNMHYGFEIEGILGMDFLKHSKAVIDIDADDIRFR